MTKYKPYKLYQLYVVVYCALIVGCTLMGLRYTYIHVPYTHFTFQLGAAVYLFPAVFIIDDIVTEVYGYDMAKKMMWSGMLSLAIVTGLVWLAMAYPDNHKMAVNNSDYNYMFIQLPQVFLGYTVAMIVGTLFNNYLLSSLKVAWHGKYFPIRSIMSSAAGELIYQVIGTTIAFWGRLDFLHDTVAIIVFCYFYKLLFDVVGSVISYPLQKWTKKKEGIDVYDHNVSLNPFKH